MSPELGRTPDTRHRRAREILVRAIVDRSSVTDAELSAVARWLWSAAGGSEARPFDLKAAMRKRGVTNVELARALGVGKRIITYWRNGERRPSKEMAERIAVVLKIPRLRFITAVAGRRARPPEHLRVRVYDPNEPLTGKNLAAARRLCGLTQPKLAALAGVKVTQLQSWERRGKGPSAALRKVQEIVRGKLGKR
jgi:DNA-binding transcriptional regulator YiaG